MRYRVDYTDTFEDGDEIAGSDFLDSVATLEEARALAAKMSEQYQWASISDTSLGRQHAPIEMWEYGERRRPPTT